MLYGHGDDTYKYKDIKINFSSNIYNHFDHENLFRHLADKLDDVQNYPEPTPQTLEIELGMMLGLTPEQVMVTNGATEAIYLVAQTFRRSKSAILQPTFSEYADACVLHEHELTNIYSLDYLNPDIQMLWLCNPNNPTGAVIEKESLLAFIMKNKEVIIVVDASYSPFTIKDMPTPVELVECPNVLMLHSMTKEYSIPGLRLGYVTGGETLLAQVRRQRMPWSVNRVAINAGHYLLMHFDEYRFDLDALMKERERMSDALRSLGIIEVWPSNTHILLCKLRFGKASSLKDYLAREHGILIRDASNFSGLDSSFFRIAVQSPEEDDVLIRCIAEWIAR